MITKTLLYLTISLLLTNCSLVVSSIEIGSTMILYPFVAASLEAEESLQKRKWSGAYYTTAWVTDDAGGMYYNYKFKVKNKKELAEWEDYARRGQIGPITYHPKKAK